MRSVRFDRQSFLIDGHRRYLLIGTVNYFRMHPSDWEHRLRLFKQSGFNTVDTYVAWGFHEPVEGECDFDSPARRLDRYLTLCHSLGLFVYFRPGPYICNEFDGGGLPPWLPHTPNLEIRQNDANYLAIVKRYLSRVNAIATRHQHTRGGPIILYAIENELDFYPTRDVAGYMTALRDHVRADGIDVPLTACVGQRTPIEKAMGFIDDVIPTPNIYVGGEAIEREATAALDALHAARSVTGKPYDVPPFVTEMGRDENSLRRILSAGFKGLGPFNFAGGSNWDRYHAVNNWGDYKQLTTSIDFGGMIAFDGTIGQTYFDARRLARFIDCVEPELTTASPKHEATRVAESESAIRPHTLVSDDATFVFLPNLTDQPASIAIDVSGQRVPATGTITVPPKKTPIVTVGLSLNRFGIDASIAYCTAEFWSLRLEADALFIELLLREGNAGEILFASAAPSTPVALEVGFAQTFTIAGKQVALRVLDERVAEREGIEDQLELGQAIDLLSESWSVTAKPRAAVSSQWTGALAGLESLGVYYGAGEYETEIDREIAVRTLSIDYAADHISLWIDDHFHGTTLRDGNAWKVELDVAPGRHRVRIRAAGWGRPCFHDAKWPAAKLGSPRGLVGAFRVDGAAVESRWSFTADPLAPPIVEGKSRSIDLASLRVKGGECLVARWLLANDCPHGAVLEFAGTDLEGLVHVNDVGIARFGFGSIYRFTGGPADRVLLPGELMRKGATLTVTLRGTQTAEGVFERLRLRRLESKAR
jgi:hypothetical protein